MKTFKYWVIIFFMLGAIFIFAALASQKSLADLYRSGKVRFVPELTLDDNSMPEDIFFESPFSIACDEKGNVYICDYRANNIKKFDASGKFIKIIGREGQGPGEFSWPYQATLAKDRLFVWDMRNRRLCVLNPDGEFIKSEKITFATGRPQKMRSLPNGDIVIEMEKTYFGEPDKPQDCTIELYSPDLEHKKTIYSHEVWRNKYIRGEFGLTNVPQPFSPRVYWDVSPDGKIIIGYSEKYEVSIYDNVGEKLSTFTHSYEPVKVIEEDKKRHFAGMTFSRGGEVKQGAPDFIVKNTKFPKYKPAFNNILVDSEGNILVHVNRKDRDEMYRYFDAFNPEGNFIAKVQIVGDVSFPALPWVIIKNKSFWLWKTGEDELTKVIKYNISN